MPKTRFKDFHYPTRWEIDRGGYSIVGGKVIHTLIRSEVFPVIHKTGIRIDAVLSLERSDRIGHWIILGRVPSNALDELPYSACPWYGCSAGYTERGLAWVDSGHDSPFYLGRYIPFGPRQEMREVDSSDWNVWLALCIGLRVNGFHCPVRRCPILERSGENEAKDKAHRPRRGKKTGAVS